jgi:hypothetical protein
MSLQELNDKLYSRDGISDAAPSEPYDPAAPAADASLKFGSTEAWSGPTAEEEAKKAARHRLKKTIAIGLGIIAALALIIGIVFKVRSMLFSEDRVTLVISGPQNVASAELVTYAFSYGNDNLATLHDATLVITYVDSFHPETAGNMKLSGHQIEIPIGDIGRRETGKTSISGKFYGSRGELSYLRASLHYAPSNTSATFEKAVQFGVNLASSPISLEISAPIELATGQDIAYVVDYRNESAESFTGIRLRMDYPAGFHFVASEPAPADGENVWNIGELLGNGSGKVTIRGTITGGRDEYKKVGGMIGYMQGDGKFIAYNVNERQTKIIASPLSVYQTVNEKTDETVAPGEVLAYKIKYKNEGSIGVRDAIVAVEIDSPYLDFSKLQLPRGGAYDQVKKVVIWKASDIPELARVDPGKGGELAFAIPVKEIGAITGNEKNISIRSKAMIDSPDVPTPIGSNKIIASDTLYVKLGALVMVDLKGYYQDASFANTGPIPPVVGQETTYTLRLNLTNSSNDVTDARAVISLPTNVTYKQKSLPASETVVWNGRTNELIWEVGTLSSSSKRELAIQIGVTPGANQAGQEIVIVNKTVFTANDSFTKEDIRIEKTAKSGNLPEDPSIGVSGGRVSAQ